LLAAEGVLATVDLEGVREFTGRIAPSSLRIQSHGASVSGQPDVADIEVELEDFTYRLERNITPSDGLVIENAYVCHPLYPAQSAVHRLLSLAGVEFDLSTTIDRVLQGFSVDEGTIKDALDTLLYEYGFTYRFDSYGKLVLFQYLYDTPSPSILLTETDIQAPLEIEKLPKEADAVELSYYPLKSRTNTLLYMADLPFGDNGLRSGWPIQPGFLWPEEANVQETWFEYDDKALAHRVNERGEVEVNKDFSSLVLTKNHTIEEKYEFGIHREVAIFENRRARIAYRNTDISPRHIYYCNIRGDVVYRSAEVVLRYDLKPNPASVDRYDALYIHDGDTARRLCAFRAERIRSACWRYRFKLDYSLPLGSILRLIDPYAGIDALALLTERSFDAETQVYDYRCVGLAAPTLAQPRSLAKTIKGPEGSADELTLLGAARLELTPESCSLNADWNGNVSLSDAKTQIEVRLADKLDTSNWHLSVAESSGVRGYLIQQTYYVSRLDIDAGYVDILATHKNMSLFSPLYAKWGDRTLGSFRFAKAMQLSKRFYVSKIAPVGSDPLSQSLPANQTFIENLSNYTFIEKLFSKYIKLQPGGSIRGGNRYTEDGTDTGQAVPGFWQGSNGQLKIADGLIDIKDAINRRIRISTIDGLKALDAQNKIIHDIPDQAIANGEYYMGHMIWWNDPGVTLVNTPITTSQVWYTVNIARRSYTNIKGVILDVYCSYNPAQNVAWGNTRVAFRPFGSNLGPVDCFTPYVSMNLTGSYVDYLRSSMMLIIPVGPNGSELSFQYWPGQELELLFIGQRGILI